jgi:hypothetical protein
MKKKQTAVELLEQQLKERYSLMNSEPLFEQAKQMEKDQIEDAYQKGRFSGQTNWGYGNDVTAEQYYNETYGETKTKEKL